MTTTLHKKDIQNLADIQLMVDTFYTSVRADEVLGSIFENVLKDRWPQHLAKMYTFWQTVLLDEYTYQGTPFPPHAKLPVQQEHFNHWVQLFNATIDDLFEGSKAERAKWQGQRMAEMFLSKINYYRNSNAVPLV